MNITNSNNCNSTDAYSYRRMRATSAYQKMEEKQRARHPWIDKWLFLNAILPCYKGLNLKDRNLKIVVKGWIGKDGKGDYYHIKNAQKRIQETHPNWTIQLVLQVECLVDYHRERDFPANDKDCHVYGTMKECNTLENWEQREPYEAGLLAVQNADFVIDLPHESGACSLSGEPLKSLRIIENGSYVTGFPSGIGLGTRWFDFGLFISSLSQGKKSLENIENKALKKFLLSRPENVSENENSHSSELYFGYSHSTSIDYFLACCAAAHERDTKNIDIIVSLPYNWEPYHFRTCPNYHEKYMNFFKKCGIKEIQFFSLQRQTPHLNILDSKNVYEYEKNGTIPVQQEGITVRTLDPFPLSNNDVHILMSHAVMGGCTGDMSLKDAIEEMSLIHYEIRKHKNEFFDSFIQLAEEFFGQEEDKSFVNYLKALKKRSEQWEKDDFKLVEEIGTLAGKEVTQEQARRFYTFLFQYYNFDPVFFDMIKRKIVLKENPDLKEQEKKLRKSFYKGELNLGEASLKLHQMLAEHQSLKPFIDQNQMANCNHNQKEGHLSQHKTSSFA